MKVNGAGHQDPRSHLDRLYSSDDDVEVSVVSHDCVEQQNGLVALF